MPSVNFSLKYKIQNKEAARAQHKRTFNTLNWL